MYIFQSWFKLKTTSHTRGNHHQMRQGENYNNNYEIGTISTLFFISHRRCTTHTLLFFEWVCVCDSIQFSADKRFGELTASTGLTIFSIEPAVAHWFNHSDNITFLCRWWIDNKTGDERVLLHFLNKVDWNSIPRTILIWLLPSNSDLDQFQLRRRIRPLPDLMDWWVVVVRTVVLAERQCERN